MCVYVCCVAQQLTPHPTRAKVVVTPCQLLLCITHLQYPCGTLVNTLRRCGVLRPE